MSPPQTQRGPERRTRGPEIAADQANYIAPERTSLLRHEVVIGEECEPSGRRKLPVTVVKDCCFCGGKHFHRGRTPDQRVAGVRVSGCSSRRYWIALIAVPAQRRRSA